MSLYTKLDPLPQAPGVYLMKGVRGEILYIGKARNLAARVRSYFQTRPEVSPKTRVLVSKIADIECIVVASDLEALVLEGNLIKKHRPRYNVLLRDDKNYPFLRLPMEEDYPRFEIVRYMKPDGARYYGPYIPAGGLYEMLRTLRRIFPLPNCTIEINGRAERPCIEYEIGRCLAPCTGKQSREAYREMIQQVQLFLEGKDRRLISDLRTAMQKQADALKFEEAARLRDRIAKIERALEKQRITSARMDDLDVIGVAQRDGAIAVQILLIRGGLLVGRKHFLFGLAGADQDIVPDMDRHDTFLTAFLQQFYRQEGRVPPVILMPTSPADIQTLIQWFCQQRGKRVRLMVPKRGRGMQLMELAIQNAMLALQNRPALSGEALLRSAQERFSLRHVPHRIEGYDISNLMGTAAVGAMVVFENGEAKKDAYRRFQIKTVTGANDFAMIAEVVRRRLSEAVSPSDDAHATEHHPWRLPDLMLIDGGQGQVSAVLSVLAQQGLDTKIDLMGLAKEREDRDERVYLPGASHSVPLDKGDALRHLLTHIRDEAHRFAVSYHRKIRSRRMLTSVLNQVMGIGKARHLSLLRHLGHLDRIRSATVEELAAVPLMNRTVAARLYDALHVDVPQQARSISPL